MIAKISYEKAKLYGRNKLVAKVSNKKKPLVMAVYVDNTDISEAIDLSVGNKSICTLIYEGLETHMELLSHVDSKGVNVCVIRQVPTDVTEQDIEFLLHSVPSWMTLVVDLPEDFSNMEFVYNICSKFSQVRFAGGYLFSMEGVRLGICDDSLLSSLGVKLDGSLIRQKFGCDCDVCDIDDLEVEVSTTKERAQGQSSSSTGVAAPKKKVMMFSDLFSQPSLFGNSGSL